MNNDAKIAKFIRHVIGRKTWTVEL